MKTCRRCFEAKEADAYAPYKVVEGRTYRRRTCRSCTNEQRSQRITRDVQRVYEYRSKYGVELAEVLALLEDQKAVCPVCTDAVQFPGDDLDHDHKTGKPRGILHRRCNMLLGYAKDDPERLINAANYLRSAA